jgi:3-hydroxybutyryl-CoA dehydratase
MATLTSLDLWFDDLQVGDTFITRRRTVTDTDIVLFSGLSGDYSPLHTDDLFAAEGPFGGRVAHGTLTLAIASGLTFSLSLPGEKIKAFYGLDRVRFLSPVRAGDTIHVVGEIEELAVRDEKTGIMTRRDEIINQEGTLVAVLRKRTLQARSPDVR